MVRGGRFFSLVGQIHQFFSYPLAIIMEVEMKDEKSWNTWNVSLWINNDYDMYKAMVRHRPYNAEKAKWFFLKAFRTGRTPDMEKSCVNNVDWAEVAEAFNGE